MRQAWTDECDQVTLDHLKDCLKHKELPNIDYLAEATARSVSAVKSRIRDYHADLYKQCKANAEPPARPPAAASSSRRWVQGDLVCIIQVFEWQPQISYQCTIR